LSLEISRDDEEFRNREFQEPEFIRLRSLYLASKAIIEGESLLASGFPAPSLTRHLRDQTLLHDVDRTTLNIWEGFANGAIRELTDVGLENVAQAVVDRAIQEEGE